MLTHQTHLRNENFLAVVLNGKSEVAPRPRLIVILENRQKEHKVGDVEDVLVLVTLNNQITSEYRHYCRRQHRPQCTEIQWIDMHSLRVLPFA